MYESPIEIIQHKIRSDISSHVDDAIYTAVVRADIHVDRDELIKALRYDRGQYEKGFSDGLDEGKLKWISVEDRLPEEKTAVLGFGVRSMTYLENDPFPAMHIVHSRGEDEGWFTFWNGEYVDVTHWMPLPEPPKEE